MRLSQATLGLAGSPGMEGARPHVSYEVIAFDAKGRSTAAVKRSRRPELALTAPGRERAWPQVRRPTTPEGRSATAR